MALFAGELLKLTILSFSDKDFLSVPIPFPVMYNPTEYSQTFKSVYSCEEHIGASEGSELKFRRIESETVKFDFVFDATGASINSIQGTVAKAAGSVDVQIALLKQLTISVDGTIHRPRYLQILWGTFIFSCQLTTMTVKYSLFNADGRPLRAKVTCDFKKHTPRTLQALLGNLSSPDLTHTRLIKAGETLPLIAKEVYGDPAFYTEIARVNGLNNFRKLKQGDKLVLPPIDKTESIQTDS